MFDSWIKGFLKQFLFECVGMLSIIMYPTIHNLVAFLILNKEGMKAQSYSLLTVLLQLQHKAVYKYRHTKRKGSDL